jgi:hypothetical protein
MPPPPRTPPPLGWQPGPAYRWPAPPPGPPRRRRVGPLAWAGIGGGLVIVLGVIWAAAGGGSTAGSSSVGSSSGGDPQPAGQVATGRHVARAGNLAFQFKGITCGYAATLAVYSDPEVTGAQPVGTTECIIKLRVTNDKVRAQTFFDSDQYAYDARGHQFSADVHSVDLVGDKDDTRLNPGVSITALVPFDIPAGDLITRLELHDSELSGQATVKL